MKKQKDQKESGLKVICKSYCQYNNDGEDSTESYCYRGTTNTSHTVEGLELVDRYPDVTCCFPVVEGDDVYLVYVIYSTGDSFGHDTDSSIVFIDVFQNKEKAEATAQLIRKHADWYLEKNARWARLDQKKKDQPSFKDSYSLEYIRENGKKNTLSTSWNGYFESLSSVVVEKFTINSKYLKRF